MWTVALSPGAIAIGALQRPDCPMSIGRLGNVRHYARFATIAAMHVTSVVVSRGRRPLGVVEMDHDPLNCLAGV